MATNSRFLDYVLQTLRWLEKGAFDQVDLRDASVDGPGEAAILASLRGVHSSLKSVAVQAHRIAQGDYTAEIAPRNDQDELGIALFKMTKTLRDVATVAKAISVGDYSASVEPKGEKDELAKAINEMVVNLRRVTASYEAEVWLKTGQARLADVMRGDLDLPALCKNVITCLARHLGAPVGLMYLSDEESVLHLVGTYACPRQERLPREIYPGEGLVGEAALQQEVTLVSDVPEHYLAVHSGLGEAVPRHIVAAPLVLEGRVRGVVELGAFKPLTELQIEFLKLVDEAIAIAVGSVESRQKLQQLLEEAQRQAEELQVQAEELQSQQEQLRAANEELEEQTQRLLASEESLRVQTEELQAANEELEEKSQHLQRQKIDIQTKNSELETARDAVEQQAHQLARASRYKSDFLANMSHELRTPLNSMLILAASLAQNEDGNLTAKQVEAAQVIHGSGKDLVSLINDILDLSKVEAGRLHVEFDEVHVREIADRLRTQFSPVAASKGLHFAVLSDAGLPDSFTTDGQRAEQILRNLLSNAMKFTEQGSVTLRFHRPGSQTRFQSSSLSGSSAIAISVIDTGIGIPEAKRLDIFEAFQQADGSTSRKFGGTGLGLTISRELARLLGGEIHLASTEGKGSTFTLYLPFSPPDACSGNGGPETETRQALVTVADGAPPPAAPEVEPSASGDCPPDDRDQIRDGDKSILIIEDDVRFARILVDVSRRHGYRCFTAALGRSGLMLAVKHKPTAIILDLGLPDISGLDVLDQLKNDLPTRHIPVHVISGLDERPAALERGAAGYLAKPASPQDIDTAFRRLESVAPTKVKRVLVVEDNDAQRDALVRQIENKGIHITAAGSGREARDAIASSTFDCVILDLVLPDISGFELLRHFSRIAREQRPPVIVYTARELTHAEHAELCKYAESIVIKGANSLERVLDEVSLFLHSIDGTLSPAQRKTIRLLHDPDRVLRGKKILLVDDDARNTFALSAVLEKAGLEVVIADNGRLALERLDSESDIDLVVMDIMMPVMDGYEAMEAIRSRARFQKLPILALTAKAMPEDRAKSLRSGANDYLTKPVDVEKLLSMMRVWLFHEEPKTV